jgi:hypothetical protein
MEPPESTQCRRSRPRERVVRATRKRSFGSDFWSYWRTGSCQFVEKRLCLFQIDGVEAFGDPAVDRRQQIDGHVARVSLGQHSRQRRGGAELCGDVELNFAPGAGCARRAPYVLRTLTDIPANIELSANFHVLRQLRNRRAIFAPLVIFGRFICLLRSAEAFAVKRTRSLATRENSHEIMRVFTPVRADRGSGRASRSLTPRLNEISPAAECRPQC